MRVRCHQGHNKDVTNQEVPKKFLKAADGCNVVNRRSQRVGTMETDARKKKKKKKKERAHSPNNDGSSCTRLMAENYTTEKSPGNGTLNPSPYSPSPSTSSLSYLLALRLYIQDWHLPKRGRQLKL
jgi:hypothetical protein